MNKKVFAFVGLSAGLVSYYFYQSSFNNNSLIPYDDDVINDIIKGNTITMFSTTVCPYCTSAKRLLDKENIEYKVIELNNHPHGQYIAQCLINVTNQRTVPNIYIGNKHIGGYDKLYSLIKYNPNQFNKLINQSKSNIKE